MTQKLIYYIVDAFTRAAFKGNSAAIVLLDPNQSSPPLSTKTQQSIATEFNLAETAFLTPVNSEKGLFGLRWFTPTIEFPLCGHATLATAAIIFSDYGGPLLPESITEVNFQTLSGILIARVLLDGRIELEFPAGETKSINDKQEIKSAIQHSFYNDPKLNVVFIGKGEGASFGKYILVEIEGVEIEGASIASGPLQILCPQAEVIIFTQRARDAGTTFISRVFCPREADPEDPVTGSAHCMLGPYWSVRLDIEESQEMTGKQVSPRSGEVGVVWDHNRGVCRLRGYTKIAAKGELYLPEPYLTS